MSYGQDYSLDHGYEGVEAVAEERAAFIRRTYAHLAGAILAFIALEAIFLSIQPLKTGVIQLLSVSPYSWLVVMVAFMAVGYLAQSWAQSDVSIGKQYLGLGLYVVIEALIVLPLLIIATDFVGDKSLIPTAGILTLAVFGGLTMTVLITKKDFSFLGSALSICSFIALGTIVAAIIFGFSLGMFFTVAMIALMSGYILYYTSNVLHHYHTTQHVAAALALFAAIATLFWYILRLLILLSGRE